MSGTLDLLQRSLLGSYVTDDGVLRFAPRLLNRLDGVAFSMRFRGTSLRVGIKGEELTVLAEAEGFRGPLRIGVGDELRHMGPGESRVFALAVQPPSDGP
jgi:trehalose/maltose hydrolase-like predicted phosphorylase